MAVIDFNGSNIYRIWNCVMGGDTEKVEEEDNMEITLGFLKEKNACGEAIEEFVKQGEKYNGETNAIIVLQELIKDKQLAWANWLIVRCMTYRQYVGYAVFAAEQVIDIFEKKYPDDKRPRQAIEATRKCIDSPTEENKSAADAAYAAYAAADAAADAADAAMKIKILEYGIGLLRKE